MSMNNSPTVIIGKVFNDNDIPNRLYEYLVEGKHDLLRYQSGETNHLKPCIGIVLGDWDKYGGNIGDIVLVDSPDDLNTRITNVFIEINKLGLECKREEIKLYFRDNWG